MAKGVTLQEQRKMYSLMFGDDSCHFDETEIRECDSYDDAISDCMAMLQYSVDQGNKEEVSYWRKLLQENKVQRRLLVS